MFKYNFQVQYIFKHCSNPSWFIVQNILHVYRLSRIAPKIFNVTEQCWARWLITQRIVDICSCQWSCGRTWRKSPSCRRTPGNSASSPGAPEGKQVSANLRKNRCIWGEANFSKQVDFFLADKLNHRVWEHMLYLLLANSALFEVWVDRIETVFPRCQ